MKKLLICLLFSSLVCAEARAGEWRAANEKELVPVIPAPAQVEKERIETELRTASGITDGRGKYVAGVALNTAGYAAASKYSHFLIVQSPIEIGDIKFAPGEYVFGFQKKNEDTLTVKFYDSRSGQLIGSVEAGRLNRAGRIASFRISPPSEHSALEIGRFGVKYRLSD